MRKAVFFDRDGVINVDKGYLSRIDEFEWVDGAREAISMLTKRGYAVVIVTNQSGIARGYYTEDDVCRLHEWMCRQIESAGGHVTAVYYCPYLEGAPIHKYDKKSDWRKPEPGMIRQAAKDWDIDLSRSIMIGDMPRDVECGERAGVSSYLFSGGSLFDFVSRIIEVKESHESI